MSLFSRLNPANIIPRFPAYSGPYAVGSFEIEIPVTSLVQPRSVGDVAETVQFRVFYPTQKPTEGAAGAAAGCWWGRGDKEGESSGPSSVGTKPVRWLPEPHQREYLSAYARFLGASSGFAEIVSHISRLLHYISVPVIADAPLLPSAPEFRFPTMIFSHGLGGTRLAYSHLCCSIASYGVVVIAPEHRDGSAPVSFVKVPTSTTSGCKETQISGAKPSSGEPGIGKQSATGSGSLSNGRVQVDYMAYPHHPSEETANGRNRQLEIRLREVSLIYSALSKLDAGKIPVDTMVSSDENFGNGTGGTGRKLLGMLKDRLDIREPGRVIWAGHSFGAATMFQFVKSIYHTSPPEFTSRDDYRPLFTSDPSDDPSILPLKNQITPDSPLMLLDLWCLPLLGKRTSYLFKQPLPQIRAGKGRNILVVMSEEFWKWKENLNGVRRVLSSDPGRKRGGEENKWFEQWDDEHERLLAHTTAPAIPVPIPNTNTAHAPMASKENSQLLEIGGQIIPPDGTTPEQTRPPSPANVAQPRFFYALKSAHLSQSDFGILFPHAIRKAVDPERILELNVRAAVQWLREAGFAIGEENEGDREVFEGEVAGWSRIGFEEKV